LFYSHSKPSKEIEKKADKTSLLGIIKPHNEISSILEPR